MNIKELDDCMREADFGSKKPNKRLLDKKTSIKLFNETIDRELNCNSEYSKSENFDDIVDKLFSMDNVHVALTPCDYHFDKDGKYVGEFPTRTHRSLDEYAIIDSVKSYLDKGAVVYLYLFYRVEQEVVYSDKLEKTDTYWWRMITQKEE